MNRDFNIGKKIIFLLLNCKDCLKLRLDVVLLVY